jgi:hypothetical protein
MNKNTLATILLILGVYVFFSGVSYLVFSQTKTTTSKKSTQAPLPNAKGDLSFDQSLPRTEECPLNGIKYSKQQREWWEKHRPLGVMIENHEESRPQSGLSAADVIYEAVAEGGITRFLAVFYCQDTNPLGPVRSARTYFMDFISEYGEYPLYVHVGGANRPGPANALGQIEDYEWVGYNDLNQFSIGFPTFWRDYNRLGHAVATEHTMYSSTTRLWDLAKKRGLTNIDKEEVEWNEKFVQYTFADDVSAADRPASQTVHLEAWEGYKQYAVDWTYDKATNTYSRKNGGVAHLDKNNNKPLTAKNIIVLSMQETQLNDEEHHILYRTKGTGRATIFMNGKEIKGTWRKSTRTGRTLVFDANGKGIEFVRGVLWFSILPTDGVLTVK